MSETKSISVPFALEYETHPLAEFQAGGHFVPGMQDEEQRRRPWAGETVHVLILKHMGGHVLRVVADSWQEAERMMVANIKSTLLGLWTAQQSTVFSYDQMKRLVDRVSTMQDFMDSRFKGMRAGPFADAFEAAMFYMDQRDKGNVQ